MSSSVPPKQRVRRILEGASCYLSPQLCFGRSLPKGVVLAPGEECLGVIRSTRLEAVLTERGACFRKGSGWGLVPYKEVEEVSFPEKSDVEGCLRIRTEDGSFELLRGNPDLWTVGRFFMRCAEDAREA